ncbi:MAG: hypothetical protein LBC94_10435 [Desulfovibrio sp.]|nr:hypothetical protein [Desulfovibrio sp.]
MKTKGSSRPAKFQRRRTLRLTDYEDALLSEQAGIAGLSMSEYMRRRVFGGRPIVAHADAIMVRELRRVGGLLKHNFETLRQGNADVEWNQKQEYALRALIAAIEKISADSHDR